MMNKEKKKVYIEEMKNFFNKTNSVLVTHYQGLSVKQIDELRSVKNGNTCCGVSIPLYIIIFHENS